MSPAHPPLTLLQTLHRVLQDEARLLEAEDIVALQAVVERKDGLIRQVGLLFQSDASEPLDDSLLTVLEQCHRQNIANGERIEARRRQVQERLGRLSQTATYTAAGGVHRGRAGQWAAST